MNVGGRGPGSLPCGHAISMRARGPATLRETRHISLDAQPLRPNPCVSLLDGLPAAPQGPWSPSEQRLSDTIALATTCTLCEEVCNTGTRRPACTLIILTWIPTLRNRAPASRLRSLRTSMVAKSSGDHRLKTWRAPVRGWRCPPVTWKRLALAQRLTEVRCRDALPTRQNHHQ